MEEKNLSTKEKLVERAKKLAESENLTNVLDQVKDLRRQWRRTEGEDESFYDKELSDVFETYIDQISAREKEVTTTVEERKREVIEKAKEVLNEKNFKKATQTMNDLMDEWKSTGRANKDLDDELWNEFREIRNEFFDKRKAYYAELNEKFNATKAVKEELIAKAKEANQLENIKELTAQMDALMEEWKKAGSAGRDTDDALWKEFSAERKAFFAKRNAYYDNLKEMYNQRADAKRELIAAAKKNLAMSEFSEDEINAMKELRSKWKTIGNAGRDSEDALWKEFNETMSIYFENLKYYKD